MAKENYRPDHPDVFFGVFTRDAMEHSSSGVISSHIDGSGFPEVGHFVRVIFNAMHIDSDIDYYGYKHGRGKVKYEYTIFHKDYAVYCTMDRPITDLMIKMLPDTPASRILFGKAGK